MMIDELPNDLSMKHGNSVDFTGCRQQHIAA
jgi:hypothetical protein